MGIRSFFRLLFLLAIASSLPSCKSARDPELMGIENLRIHRFGLMESSLSFDMHYFNPNKYGLKLKEANGDAWMDGNLLGHFTVDTFVHIPANGDFRLPVKLKMDMSHFVENISAAFTDKQVTLKLDGMARTGKGFIYINYPIRYEGKEKFSDLLK